MKKKRPTDGYQTVANRIEKKGIHPTQLLSHCARRNLAVPMGVGASSVGAAEGCGRGWGPRHTSLGDMPESCVAAVLLYLDPAEICQVACLNRAFRGAASADCIWAAKLPANHRYLAALAAAADDDDCSCGCDGVAAEGSCSTVAIKKELYARLCRPTPFDGGTKVISLFFFYLVVCNYIVIKTLFCTLMFVK